MIIPTKHLGNLKTKHGGKRIVLCTGSFDLPHAGHVLFFEDCKKLGDILVVGVGSDKTVRALKGRDRPVLNQYVRAKTVDAFKPVDYVYIDTLGTPTIPLSSLDEALKILRPHIYAVNSDAFDMKSRKAMIKRYGVKFIILKRDCPVKFKLISTTGIITKIRKQKLS